MYDFIWEQFAHATDDWSPEYKAILHSTEVSIIREKDQVRVVVKPTVTGPKADQMKDYLLKVAAGPVSRILGGLKCKVTIYE